MGMQRCSAAFSWARRASAVGDRLMHGPKAGFNFEQMGLLDIRLGAVAHLSAQRVRPIYIRAVPCCESRLFSRWAPLPCWPF